MGNQYAQTHFLYHRLDDLKGMGKLKNETT